jgi:hypothetical protein
MVASASATAAGKGNKNAETPNGDDQFEELSLPEIDGWYDPPTQSKIQGRILAAKCIQNDQGEDQYFLFLQLTQPCKAKKKGGDVVPLAPGHILGVGLKVKLLDLLDYVEAKPLIRIEALDKIKTKRGSMWNFKFGVAKGTKRTPFVKSSVVAAKADDADSDASEPWGS